jgi:hypothetical protein
MISPGAEFIAEIASGERAIGVAVWVPWIAGEVRQEVVGAAALAASAWAMSWHGCEVE